MKKICAIIVAVVALLTPATSQALGLRVGPRVGMNVNGLHFNDKLFSSSNRAGFTGGLELELSLPLGLCVDASVMYAHRSIGVKAENNVNSKADETQTPSTSTTVDNKGRDYISVPINLKWNLGLPLVGKVVAPYIFTGPDFAFRVSKKAIQEAIEDKAVDVAWDFGIGLQIVKHLQISAAYGLGLTKYANKVGLTSSSKDVTARTNNWTVTAAWLF